MKADLLLVCLAILLLSACGKDFKQSDGNAVLSDQDVSRIVLVGGTLISGMETYGFFEYDLLRKYTDADLSLRNIGWPADDVYGLARSQFGSAQNTRSWQPPTAEEGFGSRVLMQHIEAADPSTLVIGYGPEIAYAKSEADFELFASGYRRLLDSASLIASRVILLTPPRHEHTPQTKEHYQEHNQWLSRASEFIREEANQRQILCVDLYDNLITEPDSAHFTENGVQLNQEGYRKMAQILLQRLGIEPTPHFTIRIDSSNQIIDQEQCTISDWASTVYGARFVLNPDLLISEGNIHADGPMAIYVDGERTGLGMDSSVHLALPKAVEHKERLLTTIKEKNRLYRYRLRPLNEAYIYLFRRHEMGHLAYEMDDLLQLVAEKEAEIRHLISQTSHYVEIERVRPWAPPKDYPEDEVPAFIPQPDIAAELEAFNHSPDLEVRLFAADPMIANPININWDTRGRAWVATSSTYPHIVPGREPNDKIIILEDTDADGVADKHTIFADQLLVPHSVMPVPGGAYVTATTQLLFLEDTDGDDIADRRRVIYDGFGNADVHHMIHGLRWTPWGDLHFTQSIYINTFVETPYGNRILNGSGTWAFRPETERLDIFSRGLINPWGEAFDAWGQAFATDGAGSSGINYIFPESAHATAVGAQDVLDGLNRNTPKNTGAEFVYSRHFPSSWQGSIITNDFRANRTVRYQVFPDQSGYQAREVETILHSDHRSYRPVDHKIGPDGALYIVDWYNPIIDHGEVDFHHPVRDRTHGRIWKVMHKHRPLVQPPDLMQLNAKELLDQLKSPEQFTRMQANRAFVERGEAPELVIDWLLQLPSDGVDAARNRLEGLWLLAALGHYHEPTLVNALQSPSPQERAAAVRMVGHWQKQDKLLPTLEHLTKDPHPQVRLEAIHALRQLGTMPAIRAVIDVLDAPLDDNLIFAIKLTLRQHKDHWLSALEAGQEPFGKAPQKELFALLTLEDQRIVPLIRALIDQPELAESLKRQAWIKLARIGDGPARELVLKQAAQQADLELLKALSNAPEAYADVPADTEALGSLLDHPNAAIRMEALRLIGRWKAKHFQDIVSDNLTTDTSLAVMTAAFHALMQLGAHEQVERTAREGQDPRQRTAATKVWIETKPEDAADAAVRLLQDLEDPELAEEIWLSFRRLERGPDIIGEALKGQKLSEEIASVGLQVAQSSGLPLQDLEEAIRTAGDIQPIGMQLTEAEQDELIADAASEGNRYRGRQIYRRKELLCASCHQVAGIGGLVGPDLTSIGSFMTPNSVLESILNPNADIKQNYETVLVTRTDGSLVSGLLHRKTDNATLIRQANGELLEIPNEEISETDVSPVSLMPAGLTRNLHRDELRDLLAYLMSLGNR